MKHGTHSAYVHLSCRCELCREGEKTYQREYRERNAERLREYDRSPDRDSRLRDVPMKRRAREMAYDRLARDRERQPCEECGATTSQLHHDDYNQALRVRRLCAACHGRAHRQPNTSGVSGLR
jgi:hypothetical protein